MALVNKAYRFALEPTTQQADKLGSWAPALRFLWNWMLAQRSDAYKASEGRVRIRYHEQAAQLAPLKKLFPWLAELPSQPLQQTLMDLDTAFVNFFEGRAEYPVFKSKLRGNPGIRWPQGVALNGRAVYLPKMGWIKARLSRKTEGTIKSATVSHDGRRWFVSILCEVELAIPEQHPGTPIGMDAGVEESLALSDGRLLRLPVATPAEEARHRLLARRVSRCLPGSRRHRKAKARLLTFRRRIGNRVHDARHKHTTTIAKNHSMVGVEALALRNMTRSARGTVEDPGTNVRQKAGLNRSLLKQGHAETVRQLGYKLGWLGGELRKVNPAFTSQTCPQCGHIAAENRPSRAVFCCVQCGHTGHADIVAANNILKAAGLAVSARGGSHQTSRESGTLRKRAA